MQGAESITIISNRKHVTIPAKEIIYVAMKGRNSEVHLSNGAKYEARIPLELLEKQLGEGFVRVYRSTLVSVTAVHEVRKKIVLINGEQLDYPIRKRREISQSIAEGQKRIIGSLTDGKAMTDDEMRQHYVSFESMPFAFADVEIAYNGVSSMTDWVFRYVNPTFAALWELTPEKMTGKPMSALFKDRDFQWQRNLNRSALFGDCLEMMALQADINEYLKMISFPTFKGHCGCILFRLTDIEFTNSSREPEKALLLYLGMLSNNAGL